MDLISLLREQARHEMEAQGDDPDAPASKPVLAVGIAEAFSLSGRVAVVTGARGGIGARTAITFAEAGADVVVADIGDCSDTVSALEATGRRCLTFTVDVTDREAVEDLAARTVEEFGGIDVWANVAGIIRYGPMLEMSEGDVRAVIDVNQLGVYWGTAAAGRRMPDGGSIINIASAGGEVAAPGISVYGMTKAAVMHLTRIAAVELGAAGVRVNAVAPGFVESPMTARWWTGDDGVVDSATREQMLGVRTAQSPLGLTGEPVDIAYALLYLASDASRFMTGQVLRPNGGVHMA